MTTRKQPAAVTTAHILRQGNTYIPGGLRDHMHSNGPCLCELRMFVWMVAFFCHAVTLSFHGNNCLWLQALPVVCWLQGAFGAVSSFVCLVDEKQRQGACWAALVSLQVGVPMAGAAGQQCTKGTSCMSCISMACNSKQHVSAIGPLPWCSKCCLPASGRGITHVCRSGPHRMHGYGTCVARSAYAKKSAKSTSWKMVVNRPGLTDLWCQRPIRFG